MGNWSYSKLQTYIDCPRKYKYVYIDKLKTEVKSDHLAIGDAFHEFLAIYSVNPNMEQSMLEKIFTKKALNSPMLVDPSCVDKYIPMIKAYMESGYRLKPMIVDGKPLIEFWYKLQLEGVCINMKLDIVTENEAVVDYKTTSKKYKQTEADNLFNEKGLQLSLYTIAYYQMFGRLPKKVGFQVIGKGEEMILQNIARKTPFTETDMENVIMFFLSKVEEAESDTVFEPSFSKCFFCSFKDRCYHER